MTPDLKKRHYGIGLRREKSKTDHFLGFLLVAAEEGKEGAIEMI